MKKLISIILFLIYFLTSVVYLDLYDFKSASNILWQDSSGACMRMSEIQNIDTPKELLGVLQNLSQKYDVNISKIFYKKKSSSGKRKIKIYTTCNSGAFDDIKLLSGRVLQNSDLSNKFISSAKTDSKNQLGRVNFFNLNSTLEIYNLSGMLYNGESPGGFWFINEKDENKLNLMKNDLQKTLNCKELEIVLLSNNEANAVSNEFYYLNRHMISVLILLYVILFLVFVYWIFSRYKEFAVRKMFGESDIKLKLNIIFKEMISLHAKSWALTGVLIFGFLIYKLGFNNLNLFFKDWLKFNLILSVVSLSLMFIPMYLIKYIKIPLMLKNKKPVKVTQKINYISKTLIGVAVITCLTNCSNNLYFLYNKNMENKIWDNSLNYGAVKSIAIFSGTVNGRDDEEEVDKLSLKIKNWFEVCNQKGAIYISTRNHRLGIEINEKQMDYLLTNNQKDEFSKVAGKSIKVNNNYLQLNPIYDINNKKINIPDHDEHTLNLVVAKKFKNFEEQIKEKYTGEFYSNNWHDYKLNIIYIKDDQKCFTYHSDWATKTQNYVIGSIIQVISNNNMHISSYGCCWCNGFYPRINNVDNPYQDLLPDIKAFGLDKLFMSADTLYEAAAKNVYELEQRFFRTIEYMVFSVALLLTLVISMSINYLEKNKVKNIIKKIHGELFIKRNISFVKSILSMWLISVFIIIVINYNYDIVYKLVDLLYLPEEIVLFNKLISGTYFNVFYMNWYVVILTILLDLIISTVFLKLYENKKISSVLKGE